MFKKNTMKENFFEELELIYAVANSLEFLIKNSQQINGQNLNHHTKSTLNENEVTEVFGLDDSTWNLNNALKYLKTLHRQSIFFTIIGFVEEQLQILSNSLFENELKKYLGSKNRIKRRKERRDINIRGKQNSITKGNLKFNDYGKFSIFLFKNKGVTSKHVGKIENYRKLRNKIVHSEKFTKPLVEFIKSHNENTLQISSNDDKYNAELSKYNLTMGSQFLEELINCVQLYFEELFNLLEEFQSVNESV